MSIIERAARRLKLFEAQQERLEIEMLQAHREAEIQTPRPAPPIPAQRIARLEDRPNRRAKSRPRSITVDGPFDTIDLARLESAGMIVPNGKRTQISEEFRVIKRPLLHLAKQHDSTASRSRNLILVTSAFPNEGKTFSSINLAISMSLELDHSVLLVDADVVRPQPSGFLGLKPRKGLMDMLLDPTLSLAQTVIRTNIERLDVLLAGRSHDQATEILASGAMTRLLDELAAQGPERIVIFDAPPLLVTTEASALAQKVGQVVMVVEAGQTSHAALKSALTQLEGCEVFGLLNRSSGSLDPDVFNYGRYKYSE